LPIRPKKGYVNLLALSINVFLKEFDVIIMEDETGGYIIHVPSFPGCHTQGDTIEELLNNIKEAINLCIETLEQ